MAIKDQKITLFMPNFGGGGAEKTMVEVGNYLFKKGYDVIFVVLKRQGPLIHRVHAGVKVVSLDCNSLALSLPLIVWYYLKNRPRYVLSTLKEMNLYCILANLLSFNFGRLVIREANTLSAEFREESSLTQRVKNFSIRYLYFLSSSIVVLSEHMRRDALKQLHLISENKLCVIKNPVNVSEITVKASEAVPKEFYEATRRGLKLVCVARVYKTKRHLLLLEVMNVLISKGIDVSLSIIGGGDEVLKKDLEMYVSKHGLQDNVFFLGFQLNPYKYVVASDIFVLLSDFEGMPNSLLEAVSLGCKTLCRDVPGAAPDIVLDSQSGFVVDSDDPLVIAEEIQKLAAASFDPLAATEYIASNHSSELIYKAYESAILGVS